MNIYQKIRETITKEGGAGVFALEEKLGVEEVRRVIKEKEAQRRAAKALPAHEEYALVACRRALERFVAKEFGVAVAAEIPPEEAAADFAIPCFQIAKVKKEDPKETAKKVAAAVLEAGFPFVDFAAAAGPYANVRVHSNQLVQETLQAVETLKEWYGAAGEGAGKTAVIEYSSPNAAKPMSVGHLRSTIIGESLKKLYEARGYTVIGINHFGDFGTQFGKLLYAMSQWRDDAALAKEPVKEMLRLYVKFHEEAKHDPALEDKGREMFKKLEEGDAALARQWVELCAVSVDEFQKIYALLEIDIDLSLGESFYQSRIPGMIARYLEKKIAVKNEDGSVAVNFTDPPAGGLPSFLLAKKDGSSLYAARDIAAAEFRIETFTPEKIIYVVGNEQTLHFRQVFKTLGLLGHDEKKFRHDGFGIVSLPEGKMSTREGRVIFLEDLIEEAIERAGKIVTEKNPDLTDEEKKEIAEAVGVGAIIYNDLSQSKEKNIQFQWDKALSMEGNSAPYLQYAYARAMSILRKAGEIPEFKKENMIIKAEQEQKLMRMIARFPEAVKNAQEADAPHIVATYLNALVQEFGRFYNECPVLTAEGGARETRLALVSATAQVIKNGLTLLGIKALERM